MNHVMLDLETLSTDSNAAIASIGAVIFCDEKLELLDEFYVNVDIQSSIDHGGVVSGSTIEFWLDQSDEARSSLLVDTRHIIDALSMFESFIREAGGIAGVWGNGAAFDNVVLANAYKRSGVYKSAPWPFYRDMCYRTMKNFYPGVEFERQGVHHNALDDAKSQANHLIEIFKSLR